MSEFLKAQYGFSDYQVAQLQYFGKISVAELSKLLIMGFIFRNQIGIYFFAVTIMLLLRTATGGLHCKKYVTCLLASLTYMFLSLILFPMFHINKVFQLILLFICMLCNYYAGPVTSVIHVPLSDKLVKRVKIQAFLVIFFYLTLTYIMPENSYINVGFWVIVLHTVQLIAARLFKKGEPYERKNCKIN